MKWTTPTCIIYGADDHLTPRSIVDSFVSNFHCTLALIPGGEHYFHTPQQLQLLDRWLELNT